MKKRLRGLIGWWLAIIMIISLLPMSAFAAVTGANTYLVQNVDEGSSEFLNDKNQTYSLELGVALDEQSEIMDEVNDATQDNYAFSGWKLWRAALSGGIFSFIDTSFSPISLNPDGTISEDTYNTLSESGNYAAALEVIFISKYKIDPQPTCDNPTVGVKETTDGGQSWTDITERDDVSYQWYQYGKKTYTVTRETEDESHVAITSFWAGDYSTETSSWLSDGTNDYIDIAFPVEDGDTLQVTAIAPNDETSTEAFVEEYSTGDYYQGENGVYTQEISQDNPDYNLYISNYADGVTFKISIIRYSIGDAVSGETENTLSTRDPGAYICQAAIGSGCVLTSNPIEYVASSGYTVLWKNYDGSVLEEDNGVADGETPVYNGETPTKPDELGYTYTFTGWSPAIAPVTGDVTYEATYSSTVVETYEISFETNGGSSISSVFVNDGSTVEQPENPSKSEYTFGGWYKDEAQTSAYDFTLPVTESFTLYAKWNAAPRTPVNNGGGGITRYTVTFETDGGTEIDDKRIRRGSSFDAPEDPVKDGWTFDGWYTDESLENLYDFDTRVTKGFTLYAKWVIKDTTEGTDEFSVSDFFIKDMHIAYIHGDGNNIRPEDYITRAEVAVIFYRLLLDDVKNNNLSDTNQFEDVSADAWYNTAVSTMAKIGILNGRTPLAFFPGDYITRAEFAAICARIDNSEFEISHTYTDIKGHWAENEIYEASSHGWINGYEDSSFRPEASITRAEVIAMINRMLGRTPGSVEDLHPDMKVWADNSDPTAWYYLIIQEATNDHGYTLNEDGTEVWSRIH